MSGTITITVTNGQGQSVSRTRNLSDANITRFQDYAEAVYPILLDDNLDPILDGNGDEQAATAAQSVQACFRAFLLGLGANVRRHEDQAAREALASIAPFEDE